VRAPQATQYHALAVQVNHSGDGRGSLGGDGGALAPLVDPVAWRRDPTGCPTHAGNCLPTHPSLAGMFCAGGADVEAGSILGGYFVQSQMWRSAHVLTVARLGGAASRF